MSKNNIEEIKTQIKLNYFTNNFTDSIRLCNILLNYNNINDDDIYWFSYYMKSLNYQKIEEYNKALRNAKKALNYINDITDNVVNHKYGTTLWLIANCYELKKNTKKAIKIHKMCISYFMEVGDEKLKMVSVFNLAKLLKNTKSMITIITHFINNNIQSTVKLYEEDMSNVKLINQMINDLYNISKNKTFNLINSLKNEELKKNLINTLVA